MQNEYNVTIENFSNSGEGIAKIDGKTVFIENTCPQDEVKIEIIKSNKNFSTAKLLDIITPSPKRINPICPMQKICGSCNMGFIDYEYQLILKKQITEDAIRKIGQLKTVINDVIPSPKITNYRQKIQYPISQKKSGNIVAGYYKPKSHEIVNIKYCPIQPTICDEIINYLREKASEYNISGYNEKTHAGDLRHVVIRGSEYSQKYLVTFILNHKQVNKKIILFTQDLYNKFDKICGICVNFNNKKTNVIFGEKTECIIGKDYVEEKLLDKTFKIGADTFFQINPISAENIFKYVKEEVSKHNNPTVLDAYAGIATFGIIVSDIAKSVVSVEENKNSIKKANDVINEYGINNIETFAQDTVKYLKSIKKKFDITILDPPRKGCSEESLKETLNHTKEKIIYVSCNPATLARDLKYLTGKGCRVESIQPFDMFCHTSHIENVAIIRV